MFNKHYDIILRLRRDFRSILVHHLVQARESLPRIQMDCLASKYNQYLVEAHFSDTGIVRV